MPPVPRRSACRARRAIGSYVLRAVLGIGILSLVLSRLNFRQLLDLLTRERPAYFLAATLIYVGGQMVAACRWRLLARMVGIGGRYLEYLLYFFIGAFTNLFVPGAGGRRCRPRPLSGPAPSRDGQGGRIGNRGPRFWTAGTDLAFISYGRPSWAGYFPSRGYHADILDRR